MEIFYFYFMGYSPIVKSLSHQAKESVMATQAVIFDLATFNPGMLRQAQNDGSHCALISELPHREAEQRLQSMFGETAHHVFSVVLAGADFSSVGHASPYQVVLRLLEVAPEDAIAVTRSPRALKAAHSARLNISGP
jgi:beta-phosphoglucomutase-like phosphatase (HAD superfamily)